MRATKTTCCDQIAEALALTFYLEGASGAMFRAPLHCLSRS